MVIFGRLLGSFGAIKFSMIEPQLLLEVGVQELHGL
jgi:hypothetical protein